MPKALVAGNDLTSVGVADKTNKQRGPEEQTHQGWNNTTPIPLNRSECYPTDSCTAREDREYQPDCLT